jgi:AcrR family transcriptional regulator
MPKDTFNNLPEEKRNHILEIAIQEFATNPYDVASISNIVRKAGIAKGSFYQYFEDKKDLYRTLIEISTDKKQTLLTELPSPSPWSDLFNYLRWQFLSTVIFEIRYPDLSQITFRAFVEEVPFPEMAEELRRRGTTQFFKQMIAQGINFGEVAVWVDSDVAAFLLEIVFYQFGKYFIKRLGLSESNTVDVKIFESEEAQQLIDNLMDIIEAGMKRSPKQREDYFNKR